MKRRDFIVGSGGAIVCLPSTVRAQSGTRIRHVGIMMPQRENDSEARIRVETLRKGLGGLGWIEGRTIRYSYRWGASSTERADAAARELVDVNPDLIFANGTPSTAALKRTTTRIPVVFAVVVDPVGAGFVQSIARPGGNITGFSTYEPEIGAKWLELLREVFPALRRVGAVHDSNFRGFNGIWRELESKAPAMGLNATLIDFRKAGDDIEASIARFAGEPGGGLVVLPTAINSFARTRIFAAAARHKLPAVYPFKHYASDGGLMAYGFDPTDLVRKSASYIDRILKGEAPGNLPVQAPNKFELMVNLKAAKQIGLIVPQPLLVRATEVIE